LIKKKKGEVDIIETEIDIAEQSSSTISYRNQELSIITITTKKFTMSNADDIVFCGNDYDEDKENDAIGFFSRICNINQFHSGQVIRPVDPIPLFDLGYEHIVLVLFPILPLSLLPFEEAAF